MPFTPKNNSRGLRASRLHAAVVCIALAGVSACAVQKRETSVGDSPVHDVQCPNFSTWEMCVAKGERRHCNGASARLLSPSVEELESFRGEGQTVSQDGKITYRTVRIICEE